MVQKDNLLLNNTYPDRWRIDVERRVRRKGVHLILGDVIPDSSSPSADGTVTTQNGKTVTTDLIVSPPSPLRYLLNSRYSQIPSRGPTPNTSFIGESLGADTVTSGRRVKVTLTLQLVAHPRIFAAGDITDWPEQKQTGKYYAHADVVSANVLSLLNGQSAVTKYKGSYEMIIVTIGKVSAVMPCHDRECTNARMASRLAELPTLACSGDSHSAIGCRLS